MDFIFVKIFIFSMIKSMKNSSSIDSNFFLHLNDNASIKILYFWEKDWYYRTSQIHTWEKKATFFQLIEVQSYNSDWVIAKTRYDFILCVFEDCQDFLGWLFLFHWALLSHFQGNFVFLFLYFYLELADNCHLTE